MTDIVPAVDNTPAAAMDQVAADVPQTWVAAMRLAGRIHGTPFVPKAMRGDAASVMACILLGEELGLGPMLALQSIHVIEGRPSAAPELMRALVNRAGHKVVVDEATVERVTLTGTRADNGATATVTWTVADAVRAGLCTVKDGKPYARSSSGKRLPWETYTRAMLLARATSELCRMIFPDVTSGLSYTPEEVSSVAGVEWAGELIDPLTSEPPAIGPAPIEEPTDAPAELVLSDGQMKLLRALYGKAGVKGGDDMKAITALILGVDHIDTHSTLTVDQASTVINRLTAVADGFVELVLDGDGNVIGLADAQPAEAPPLELDS